MDHRYTAPNGAEVQAYQITETSRYTQKLWPDWLDSRWFMTIDNQTWLDINGRELRVPDYAWVVNNGVEISVIDALEFEAYDKVVKEVEMDPSTQDLVDSGGLPEAQALRISQDVVLEELKVLWEVGETGGADELKKELKKQIGSRMTWCTCPPGQCAEAERWSCRENSPLVQS